jgi:hypothetical protein
MQHDFMDGSFDDRVHRAWTEGEWIIGEMFNEGMAFFEGYIPAIDLDRLEKLTHVPEVPANEFFPTESISFSSSNARSGG